MNSTGRILLVNDEPAFLETYGTILTSEGHAVEAVSDGPSALARLEQPGWDLVLLDRKLLGRMGPDMGLDLIQAIRQWAPDMKVILVMGVADADSVHRAFEAGAYDCLEKNAHLEAILRIKVRHALEAGRERRLAALARGRWEETLRELWSRVKAERDISVKGPLLEDLLALLFKSIPGFERTQTERKNLEEQLHIVIPNESTDPFWQQARSQYILGECTNWTKPAGPKEFETFRVNLSRRSNCCRLGFFIGIAGFTRGFAGSLAAFREQDVRIAALDSDQLGELVHFSDRAARLKALYGPALTADVQAGS